LTSVNNEIIELRISSEKSKTFTNQTTKHIEITHVEFTIEALIDELFLNLVGIKESVTNGKEVTVRNTTVRRWNFATRLQSHALLIVAV
jgi:hypothetical protein